jgi:hypothetical protein
VTGLAWSDSGYTSTGRGVVYLLLLVVLIAIVGFDLAILGVVRLKNDLEAAAVCLVIAGLSFFAALAIHF